MRAKAKAETKKIKFDFKSVRVKLFLSFIAIGVALVLSVLFWQVYFFNNYYEEMKIKQVSTVASDLYKSYRSNATDFANSINNLSEYDDMAVLMDTSEGRNPYYFSVIVESRWPINKYKEYIHYLKNELDNAKDPTEPVTFNLGEINGYDTLAYAIFLDHTPDKEAYLYIFTPLYPMNSTMKILKSQLSYVVIITLFFAFTMAVYFSRRISRPLVKMTSETKKMAKGNYDVRFPQNSYSEINMLSATLNSAAGELGAAEERRRDLIANLSHDLKTPLTMIRSYAEMIRDLSGDNKEKREQHLQVIIDESVRMGTLVSDMATISALRSDQIALDKTRFNLSDTVSSIVESFRLLGEENNYNFMLYIPKTAMVFADESRIKQVISNLTSNAVKYCGKDKTVTITIKGNGDSFKFSVSDNGPGISSKELPYIWEKYYKTSTNYVRPTKGSGLGLSIVKEILDQHEFKFGVESKVGRGTVFWVDFPVSPAPKSGRSTVAKDAASGDVAVQSNGGVGTGAKADGKAGHVGRQTNAGKQADISGHKGSDRQSDGGGQTGYGGQSDDSSQGDVTDNAQNPFLDISEEAKK